jgi:hypothetical protein
MRQVLMIALACVTVALVSGCTVVDPVYSHQMGGFPMYSSVKTSPVENASETVTRKPGQPVTVKS